MCSTSYNRTTTTISSMICGTMPRSAPRSTTESPLQFPPDLWHWPPRSAPRFVLTPAQALSLNNKLLDQIPEHPGSPQRCDDGSAQKSHNFNELLQAAERAHRQLPHVAHGHPLLKNHLDHPNNLLQNRVPEHHDLLNSARLDAPRNRTTSTISSRQWNGHIDDLLHDS